MARVELAQVRPLIVGVRSLVCGRRVDGAAGAAHAILRGIQWARGLLRSPIYYVVSYGGHMAESVQPAAERVEVVPYDPRWPALYAAERDALLAACPAQFVVVEHIGSTAVPGLGAKPVLDIMIGVRTLAEADRYCVEPIIRLGYDYVKVFEQDTPFRRYFRKNTREGTRTHQIHLVEYGSDWWKRHLAFRDYLRVHGDARQAYEQLKRDLATREFETGSDYANAKTDFIKAIETKAMADQQP